MTDESPPGSPPPPPRALELPRPGVATSLASARPGEVVYSTRGGEVMTAGRVRSTKIWTWVALGAVLVGLGASYGVMLSPVAAVVSVSVLGGLMAWRWRKTRALRAAMALSSLGRWEEARAALLELDRGWLPQGIRPAVKVLLASTAVLLGDHRECLRLLDELEAKRSWRYVFRTVVMRVQQASLRSSALVSLGRAGEARAQRERLRELLAAERARHPGRRSEAFEYFGQATELDVAAALDAPDELPDNDTLHQWAREALGRTAFGQILVSLAWAFDRRGDEAMARHLLAEAPARVQRWSLSTKNPRLWAWAEQKQRAWELPPLARPLP